MSLPPHLPSVYRPYAVPSKVSRIDPLLLDFKRTTAVPTILLCCIHAQGAHFTCARSRLRFVLVTAYITVITGTGRSKTQLVRASWHALLLNIQTTAAALAEQSPAGMPNPTVPCSAGRAPFTLGVLVSCREAVSLHMISNLSEFTRAPREERWMGRMGSTDELIDRLYSSSRIDGWVGG